MSLPGPRRRTAACLLLAGLTGLCGCDVLTDAPLTDSEMSAFLAEADSRATRSRGRAFQATAVAAADQRSAITGALSLSQALQGEDVEAITTALTNLRHAVAAAESAVSARRSSAGQDQVAVPGEESLPGASGRGGDGESAGPDRPGEGESESPAQVGAPSDSEPSGPQDSAEPAQGPPS